MRSPVDPRILPLLREYSAGRISAPNAAFEIQALGLLGYDDPSASEVILWTRAAGLRLPGPTKEEAEAEAEALRKKLGRRDS